jgi:hypothetical protein
MKPGYWSSIQAPNHGTQHQHLSAGRRYRVIKRFVDHDGSAHEIGEEWTFLGCSFLPYEDGMSFFVSLDGVQEWHLCMQWRPEEQGEILDHLAEYLAALG